MFAFLIYVLSSGAGLRAARNENQYLTISNQQNELVIRVYENELLLLPYDENTNKLGTKLKVLDRSYLYSNENTLEIKNVKPQPTVLETPTNK